LAHTCRAHGATFPQTLSTPALDRRTLRWFTASPRRATAEDHQPKGQPLHLRYSTASADSSFYIDSSFAFVLTHQIEIFFSILWRRLLKHGIFTSEQDLACQMLAFIETYNQTAKPFKWTYTGKVLEA
jgi:hypothetical protein